ncbi:MAG: hypothetical protein FWH28_04305 [Clostridiales bacterium]|nr:hypothetical protein [Clostridiales bacterium]
MRVADRAVARNYLKYLYKAQSKYAETNQRLASGNRFTKLSDDVSAGSRVLRKRMDRYKAEKQLENAQEANSELKVAEDNLMSMNWVMTMVHEDRVVRALNDPTSDEGRQIIAAEIRSMMAEFLQYANASYGNMFSYGGTNAYTGPFTVDQESGKLLYNGVKMDAIYLDPLTAKYMYPTDNIPLQDAATGEYVVRNDATGERLQIQADFVEQDPLTGAYSFKPPVLPTDPDYTTGFSFIFAAEVPMDEDIYFDVGLGIRMQGPEVNPATAFRLSYSGPDVLGYGVDPNGVSNNIYNVMYEIQRNLDTFNREAVEKWNTKLRTLLDCFRANITDIGAKTSFLDAMETRLKDSIDNHTEKIHDLMGVKDEEEATNQMMNDYVLKAVLQMGSRVLPLSLMDFIR